MLTGVSSGLIYASNIAGGGVTNNGIINANDAKTPDGLRAAIQAQNLLNNPTTDNA